MEQYFSDSFARGMLAASEYSVDADGRQKALRGLSPSFHDASASRSTGSFHRSRNENAKSRDGRTALHFAVSANCEREVRRLLAEDASYVCEADFCGATPLHYAVGAHAPEAIVKLLLVASADALATDANGVRDLCRLQRRSHAGSNAALTRSLSYR